jgi:hypothetical protein
LFLKRPLREQRTKMVKFASTLILVGSVISTVSAFSRPLALRQTQSVTKIVNEPSNFIQAQSEKRISMELKVADLDTVALVVGQETYGFGIVVLGEAVYSFLQSPSFDHAKVLIPGALAALICGFVAGPMVTSGDASSVALGLEIATGLSVLMGGSYVARMVAPFSPSPKEIAFLGLLVALAGFFSFGQNLVVNGFVTLPSIPLPSLPSIEFPSFDF